MLGTSKLLGEYLMHVPEFVAELADPHTLAKRSREQYLQEAAEYVEWRGDPEIRRVTATAPHVFEQLGAKVETAHPDYSGVLEIVLLSRGARQAAAHAEKLAQWSILSQVL